MDSGLWIVNDLCVILNIIDGEGEMVNEKLRIVNGEGGKIYTRWWAMAKRVAAARELTASLL